jgi:hypothetical protein
MIKKKTQMLLKKKIARIKGQKLMIKLCIHLLQNETTNVQLNIQNLRIRKD